MSFFSCKIVVVLLLLSCFSVNADYPDIPPLMNQCVANTQAVCEYKQKCTWSERWYPMCVERAHLSQRPPEGSFQSANLNLAEKFFVFSYGVHLSEGNSQQWHYNTNVNECARACLTSALRSRRKIRCLSFDFYPFENPLRDAPYHEETYTGMCVLNSANKDLARLRNEDQGFTDAELFYKSHFTNRPFSEYDGYYELRDPRGGALAQMLAYGEATDQISALNVWGGSRWGIFHVAGPSPLFLGLNCSSSEPSGGGDEEETIEFATSNPTTEADYIPPISGEDNEEETDSYFVGVYTPVNSFQQCPGKLGKTKAEAFCRSTGGRLCPKVVLKLADDKKIGCNLDKLSVWSTEDVDNGPEDVRFVRCCASYGYAGDCNAYTPENLEYCSSFKNVASCNTKGSGYVQQENFGYGKYLDKIRDDCVNYPEEKCKGALVRDWFERDQCIWCLSATGQGSCRPGTSYGVCGESKPASRKEFDLRLRSVCGPTTLCNLARTYRDLREIFGVGFKS